MDSIFLSSYLGISQQDESMDDDKICNAVNCTAESTQQIEVNSGEYTLILSFCDECVKIFSEGEQAK